MMAMVLIVLALAHFTHMPPMLRLFVVTAIPAIGMQIRSVRTTLVLAFAFSVQAGAYMWRSPNEAADCLTIFYLAAVFLAISFVTSYRFASRMHDLIGDIGNTMAWAVLDRDGNVLPYWRAE